jgi:hypothetical protein
VPDTISPLSIPELLEGAVSPDLESAEAAQPTAEPVLDPLKVVTFPFFILHYRMKKHHEIRGDRMVTGQYGIITRVSGSFIDERVGRFCSKFGSGVVDLTAGDYLAYGYSLYVTPFLVGDAFSIVPRS